MMSKITSQEENIHTNEAATEVPSESQQFEAGGLNQRTEIESPEPNSAHSSTVDAESTDDNSVSQTDVPELPLDKVFDILKNSRRRHALAYLKDNGGESTLSDLAEHIAAIENDVPVKAINSSQRKKVYVGLYQCHLPRMDGMRIVDFDKKRGTVELKAAADQLEPYIGESEGVKWSRVYGGVTAVGFGLFSLSTFGGASFGLTPTVVGFIVIVLMLLCSTIHAYIVREDERIVD